MLGDIVDDERRSRWRSAGSPSRSSIATRTARPSTARALPWLGWALLGLVAGFGSRGGLLGVGGAAARHRHRVGRHARRRPPPRTATSRTASARRRSASAIAVGLGAYRAPPTSRASKLLPVVSRGRSQRERPQHVDRRDGEDAVQVPDVRLLHRAPRRPRSPPGARSRRSPSAGSSARPVGRAGARVFERESLTRMALLVGTSVALVAHGFLAPGTDLIAVLRARPSSPPSARVALRDFERGAHPSIALGVGIGVFLGCFHHDFHELPEKAYQAFAVDRRDVPRELQGRTRCCSGPSRSSASPGSRSSPGSSATPTRTPFDPRATSRSSSRCARRGTASSRSSSSRSSRARRSPASPSRSARSLHGALARRASRCRSATRSSTSGGSRRSSRSAPSSASTSRATCGSGRSAGREPLSSSASFTRGFEPFEQLYARSASTEAPSPAAASRRRSPRSCSRR